MPDYSTNLAALYCHLKETTTLNTPLQRHLDKIIYLSQFCFVIGYTGLMLKFVFFNHYRKFNKSIKFSMLLLYQHTIDPFTILVGCAAVSIPSDLLVNMIKEENAKKIIK